MAIKDFYIIAGCNGAGKTTAAYTVLPEILACREFVNADEIARGLSPFCPESMALDAGKLMLKRIDELLAAGKSLAVETTLAARVYQKKILAARANGYQVTLLFFWLRSADLARERVRLRVAEGGHDIPPDVIARRYVSGIKNLFALYVPLVDETKIYDNTDGRKELIATNDGEWHIFNRKKFDLMRASL